MNHSIKASVAFDFKGEKVTSEIIVDLDVYLETNGDMDALFVDLGRSIGLDEYRHEYDVMTCQNIYFSQAEGLVVGYVQDGEVDWHGLAKAWREQCDVRAVAGIANKYFNVENIADHPKLAVALLDAYRLGAEQVSEKKQVNQGLNEGFYG